MPPRQRAINEDGDETAPLLPPPLDSSLQAEQGQAPGEGQIVPGTLAPWKVSLNLIKAS